MKRDELKLSSALKEYKFENVGQFRAIAVELGYNEEYNKGYLTFTRSSDNDVMNLSINEIRNFTQKDNDELKNQSKEEICSYFNKEKTLDASYRQSLLQEKDISIVQWEGIKTDKEGEAKDGYTVIDHKNKVCYTGNSLYNYAFDKGYTLDGKGGKLEKGIMSEMTEINGQQAKMRLNENGIAIFYRKEALIIPDSILGHKLSQKEKDDLLHGDIVNISINKNDIYLQVDRDLNMVVVRTNKELQIPKVLGNTNDYPGYELTPADKFLLANGKSLENKLIGSENGFFIANVSLTSGKKGIAFSNIQMITNSKAQEIIKSMEQQKKPGRIKVTPFVQDTYDLLPEEIKKLEKGEVMYAFGEDPVSGREYEAFLSMNPITGNIEEKFNPQVQQWMRNEWFERHFPKQNIQPQRKVVPNLTTAIVEDQTKSVSQQKTEYDQAKIRDFEKELKEAAGKSDFDKMANLKQEGYKPTEKVIEGLSKDNNLTEDQVKHIQQMFDIKPKDNKVSFDTSNKEYQAFKNAAMEGDFVKISQLKDKGFNLTPPMMKDLEVSGVSTPTMIALKKVYGLEGEKKASLNDVKLAGSQPVNKGNDLRPVTQTVNKIFSDL